MRKYNYKQTLKFRINMITLLFTLLVFFISSAFLLTIYSKMLEERIEDENQYFMSEINFEIEKKMEDLDSISKQFLPVSELGKKIIDLSQMDNYGLKSIALLDISKDLNLIEFSNPDVTLIAFYINSPDIEYISTKKINEELDYENLPVLANKSHHYFYGPNKSANFAVDSNVLSLKDNINLGLGLDTYLYVESDFSTIEDKILAKKEDGFDYEILNKNNELLYTTNPQLNANPKSKYIMDENMDKYGWKIISYISNDVMHAHQRQLFMENLSFYPIIILIGIVFSILLMRLIKKPLDTLTQGIQQMEDGDFDTLIDKTNISEIDDVISKIHNAKLNTSILLDEIRINEKKIAFGEISRLRAQINPHFLLNTLNTVHWMAVKNNQKEMSQTILTLNKILSYNMNHDYVSTLGEEIDNINQYIELQRLKYSIDYTLDNNLGNDIYLIEMPRFIFQPIVENSIVHGNGEKIKINITIDMDEYVIITIADNGGNIEPNNLDFINNNIKNPEKLGVGLSFVFSAMFNYYGRNDLIKYEQDIDGVIVHLILPFGDDIDD